MSIYKTVRARTRSIIGRAVAPQRIAHYLAKDGPRRLNIGCGYNTLPGWLNVDLGGGVRSAVWMDATCPFPIPTCSVDGVLCEHMVEHVSKNDATVLIEEVFRVLGPGGKFRIVTPDLDALIDLCREPIDAQAQNYLDFVAGLHGVAAISPGDALNIMFYEYGHCHIYEIDELRSMLEDVGFVEIAVGRAGNPIDPIFENTEGHPHFTGFENNAFEAFALEATKRVG